MPHRRNQTRCAPIDRFKKPRSCGPVAPSLFAFFFFSSYLVPAYFYKYKRCPLSHVTSSRCAAVFLYSSFAFSFSPSLLVCSLFSESLAVQQLTSPFKSVGTEINLPQQTKPFSAD